MDDPLLHLLQLHRESGGYPLHPLAQLLVFGRLVPEDLLQQLNGLNFIVSLLLGFEQLGFQSLDLALQECNIACLALQALLQPPFFLTQTRILFAEQCHFFLQQSVLPQRFC